MVTKLGDRRLRHRDTPSRRCVVADVAGQSIIVVRDRAGELRAFHNVCRHRASQLVAENTNCKVIRCPYHGWGYSLEGELLGTPYFQGLDVPAGSESIYQMTSGVAADFCKEDHPLLRVHIAQWGGLIFVNSAAEPHPIASWLGDLPQRFCDTR